MSRFAIARRTGASDADVLIATVKDGTPGHVYTYEELATALSQNGAKTFTARDVQQVVRRAFSRLLREHSRTLKNVAGVGYRVAGAGEHKELALMRKRRSDVQMRRGVTILENVNWHEMDENQRRAHEGTLLVMGAMAQQQRAVERRLQAIERAIGMRR